MTASAFAFAPVAAAPAPYLVISYKTIPLTQGQVALVDPEDYDFLMQWKWFARWNPCTRSFYATRTTPRDENSKQYSIQMHREIMRLKRGDPRQVDHVEPKQTLDNRRVNLRIATTRQNTYNRHKRIGSASKWKGVFRNGPHWKALITVDGKCLYLGTYSTEEEAAEVRNKAAKQLHGEFARSM